MANKQRSSLGRGLDALISGASQVMAPQQSSANPSEPYPLLAIESIAPNPYQLRRSSTSDDDLKLLELAASIQEHGIIQPIVVTPLHFSTDADIRYQIIAGERRWRAARLAGLEMIPTVIKNVTPQQMLELALIENIQRADLNPIEEALAYQTLIQEFGLTQEQVAKQIGKDRSTITNTLRLLQLAPTVLETLMNQQENFTAGHARALVGITRPEEQIQAMQQILTLGLNVRQAEELATRIKAAENTETATKTAPLARRPAEIESLTTDLRNALMVKVDLKCNPKGKGTLVLHFNNQEELEELYNRLVKRL